MTPTDMLGNPLTVGDMVIIVDGTSQLYGIIQSISEGGVIAASSAIDGKGNVKGMEMPGIVSVVLMPINIPFNSRQPTKLSGLTKVVKPPSVQQMQQQALKAASKEPN